MCSFESTHSLTAPSLFFSLLLSHLSRFGMSVNEDSVLRSVYYKYVHPKEVFIAEGVLVPDIARKKNTATLGGVRKSSANKGVAKPTPSEKLPFVYPYGASINVQVKYCWPSQRRFRYRVHAVRYDVM